MSGTIIFFQDQFPSNWKHIMNKYFKKNRHVLFFLYEKHLFSLNKMQNSLLRKDVKPKINIH